MKWHNIYNYYALIELSEKYTITYGSDGVNSPLNGGSDFHLRDVVQKTPFISNQYTYKHLLLNMVEVY